jgi:nicotinamidase-related amidase
LALAEGRRPNYASLSKSSVRGNDMAPVRRIAVDNCWGALIDYQDFFLAQLDHRLRSRLRVNTRNFLRLLGHFRIPIIATLERPIYRKGSMPEEISGQLGDSAKIFEKDFFDLTKDKKIKDYLAKVKRKQVIVAGCETDVCVLQSCLGLLGLGYEVYVIDELVFSSASNTQSAIERMKAEGIIFLTYKTLFYELIEAVDGGPHADKMITKFGPFPDDLPDLAK